ncbi:MAG: hypothetical protein LBJ60_02040 [Tannerellaceae bacterium]|jgi:hypothetical protein|nr:hypothetical protein [Tannerellaceae bacterium]
MKYDFIQEHCLSKKGVEEDYKQEWDALKLGASEWKRLRNDAETIAG